jgi:DNA-binding response OmpR family regulator
MNIACCMRDPALRDRVGAWLMAEGLRCEVFPDESSLLRALHHRSGIELVLMEVGHSADLEASILAWLACRGSGAVPVILLGSHWSAQRVARALEAGADDCVGQPLDRVECMARIRAVLRRSRVSRRARTCIDLAGFTLDRLSGTLQDRGVAVRLTPREFSLAWLFFSHAGERLARDAIGLAIWGAGKDVANRTIEQHVYKLRRKVPLNDDRGVAIRTTYGRGYRLDVVERKAREPGTEVRWLGWGIGQRGGPFAASTFGDVT